MELSFLYPTVFSEAANTPAHLPKEWVHSQGYVPKIFFFVILDFEVREMHSGKESWH